MSSDKYGSSSSEDELKQNNDGPKAKRARFGHPKTLMHEKAAAAANWATSAGAADVSRYDSVPVTLKVTPHEETSKWNKDAIMVDSKR
jgi:hypothetical protein